MKLEELETALAAADLTDPAERQMLADVMEERGRTEEALLLRSAHELDRFGRAVVARLPVRKVNRLRDLECPTCHARANPWMDIPGAPAAWRPCPHVLAWDGQTGAQPDGRYLHPAWRTLGPGSNFIMADLMANGRCWVAPPCGLTLVDYELGGEVTLSGRVVFCPEPDALMAALGRQAEQFGPDLDAFLARDEARLPLWQLWEAWQNASHEHRTAFVDRLTDESLAALGLRRTGGF